jgi:heme exporter protein A
MSAMPAPALQPSPVASTPAIDVRDVSKRYGSQWALARLSFQLERGKSLLLTGHNGSGKTTLLRLIATATTPSTGELRVLGHDVRTERDAVRCEVALLSHTNFLYEDLTAEQNLALFARLIGLPSPREAVAKAIARVSLTGRHQQPVRVYSAGMRKRVAIARLLLKAPSIALLDEPFGELDPAGIEEMERIIRELKDGGCSLVLATHQIEQGQALCDGRLHLAEGRSVGAA